jgi:hypothetical protein
VCGFGPNNCPFTAQKTAENSALFIEQECIYIYIGKYTTFCPLPPQEKFQLISFEKK